LSHFDVDVNQELLESDAVAIADAPAEFGISKRTLERLIVQHGIVKFRRPGDRRHYVSRVQVVKHLGYREVR